MSYPSDEQILAAIGEIEAALERLVQRGLVKRVYTLEEALFAIDGKGYTITDEGAAFADIIRTGRQN